jgi:hypothetical protein
MVSAGCMMSFCFDINFITCELSRHSKALFVFVQVAYTGGQCFVF